MQVRRVLTVAALIVATTSSPSFAQRNNDNKGKPQSTRSPQEQQDIQALVQLVDSALASDIGISMTPPAAGEKPPATAPTPKPLSMSGPDRSEGEIAVKWDLNHFVKGQMDTYVPFTLSLDKSMLASGAALYIRVVSADQAAAFGSTVAAMLTPTQGKGTPAATRPAFAWDNANFIEIPDGGKVQRALQLKPGQYVAFIAVKEKSAAPAGGGNQRNDRNRNNNQPPAAAPVGKTGLLRHDITVPDYGVAELTTSSVIVAKSVEPVTGPPADQESNPYVFGPMRIVPSPDGKFGKSAELSIIFWIYGAQAAATGKPDVTVEYNFHQKLAEGGDKYFNKTAPQQLNAQTLPPEFSVAAGHQLPGSLVVPLTSFPSGDYRLEIKITDKASGKSVTQNVTFSVLPV